MSEANAMVNTDRELWREGDDYYAASLFVTEGGGIGINVGGHVIVMPLRRWHAIAVKVRVIEAMLRDIGCKDELEEVEVR